MAVRVREAPCIYIDEQAGPQFIAAGLLVTVPDPVPIFVIVKTEPLVPLSGIFIVGVSGSLEDMLSVAVFDPGAIEINVTAIEHELPLATVEQSLACKNSFAFVPEISIEFITSGSVPIFFTTAVRVAEFPTFTEPKSIADELTKMFGLHSSPAAATVSTGVTLVGCGVTMLSVAAIPISATLKLPVFSCAFAPDIIEQSLERLPSPLSFTSQVSYFIVPAATYPPSLVV
jgi:hypothetical protein